eukprot:Phypoly_transcript_00475.p1 GENE.Phypoly_transcript_00475~~Phypoly_transcript_00475.p1  ORF type:complete len:990 (+),score=181.17 Phypoly_transcript_00475:1631-4600(+)
MPPNFVVPEKSQSDNREYRIFTLENGLQILVISDETTEKAAAAIGVGVGYHTDPDDVPGLAHLLEHMLFQGTEKYPESDTFTAFLAEHGGKSNAHTGGDETVYYFDVLQEHLRGVLDIWSQFFIAPLFNQEKTDLEIQAVDSENGKNLQSDPWRSSQLLRSRAKPGHPFGHFGTGNHKTLSAPNNLREQLLAYHAKYYSANIMKLAILGREKLDVLESWAREFFGHLPTNSVARPVMPPDAFGPEQLQKFMYTVPVKETSMLTMTWPIPPIHKSYQKKPSNYISHLVGHEAAGSILSLLKKKGWANELLSGAQSTTESFSLFRVDIELTDEGLEHANEIVVMVYQYLKLVSEKGIQAWIFDETKFISEMRFRFKNKNEPFDYVQFLVETMFTYPPEHVLSGVHLTTFFDPEMIADYLATYFSPHNLRITLSGKKFAGKTDQVEPWYGTPFKEEPFEKDFIEKFLNPPPEPGLALPEVNNLIPTDFDIRPVENEEHLKLHVLVESDLLKLWHKQDRTFLRPKANIFFAFTAPVCYQSPRNSVLTRLWTNILEDSLNEFSYAAHLAGLEYTLNSSMSGCQLVLKGFNSKLFDLTEKVLLKMHDLHVEEQRFYILREKLAREYKNANKEEQFKRALYNGNLILDHIRWHNNNYIKIVDEITVEEFREYVNKMLREIHIEGILHGNLTEEEAKKFAQAVSSTLGAKPLPKVQMPEHRIVKLPRGDYIFREPGPNPENVNHAVHNIYQIGPENARQNALLDLVSHILSDPAYQQLRNVEQLGYIVWTFASRHAGVQTLRLLIQSKNFTPDFLDERIEQFLLEARGLLGELTEEEFKNYVNSISAELLEADKTLGQETNRYWREISNECYIFDRAQREVNELQKLTQEDLLAFFDKFISPESTKRRKISIQIWPSAQSIQIADDVAKIKKDKETRADPPSTDTPLEDRADEFQKEKDRARDAPVRVREVNPVIIADYVAWKRGLSVYPLPIPGVF